MARSKIRLMIASFFVVQPRGKLLSLNDPACTDPTSPHTKPSVTAVIRIIMLILFFTLYLLPLYVVFM